MCQCKISRFFVNVIAFRDFSWRKLHALNDKILQTFTGVLCRRSIGIPNTREFDQQIAEGDTRTAFCLPGYETAGSLEVTCLSNGKWSTPNGYCRSMGPVYKDSPSFYLTIKTRYCVRGVNDYNNSPRVDEITICKC